MNHSQLRNLLLGNIAALLVASGTLVWNWAFLYARVETLEREVVTLDSNQRQLLQSYSVLSGNQSQLRREVDRLTGLHISGGSGAVLSDAGTRAREAPGEAPEEGSPVVSFPPLAARPEGGVDTAHKSR